MNVSINVWAVVLSAVVSMVIGMVYYARPVFGKQWIKLAQIDEKRMKKEVTRIMPLIFIAALVTADVVAYFMFLYHQFFASSWEISGLVSAVILWLGISVTTTFVHNVFEQRPTQLTYLTMGNRLLTLLATGAILGWLHP